MVGHTYQRTRRWKPRRRIKADGRHHIQELYNESIKCKHIHLSFFNLLTFCRIKNTKTIGFNLMLSLNRKSKRQFWPRLPHQKHQSETRLPVFWLKLQQLKFHAKNGMIWFQICVQTQQVKIWTSDSRLSRLLDTYVKSSRLMISMTRWRTTSF